MAAATYATSEDLVSLTGNLSAQRSNTAINNAINGASAYVNLAIGRPPNSNVETTDPMLELLKEATRYLAASELLTGIDGQEDTRRSLQRQADIVITKVTTLETGAEGSSDYVSSSEASTYPANPTGILYSKNMILKKRGYGYREGDSYSIGYILNNPEGYIY